MTTTGGRSGRRNVGATRLTNLRSPVEAAPLESFTIGSTVLTIERDIHFQGLALQVLLGSSLGDASVRLSSAETRGQVRFGHGQAQHSYTLWKHSFLQAASGAIRRDRKGSTFFDLHPTIFGAQLHNWVRIPHIPSRQRQVSRRADPMMIAMLDPMAFAVWYMDDGTFGGSYQKWGYGKSSIAATATDSHSLSLLAQRIKDIGGEKPSVSQRGLTFNASATWAFHRLIAPYVPMCMAYKIHPKLHHLCHAHQPGNNDISPAFACVPATVLRLGAKPASKATRGYAVSVDDGWSYCLDGIVSG